ncbi:MAG: hypothetical protein HY360_16375 [Verrucomicrobia bacterium]|nr:hypothetical protein [Verrucomicrobiota bacterium]
MVVDGQVAAQALLEKPIGEATVRLYAWTGQAWFDNVRVQTSAQADPVPEEVVRAVEEHLGKDQAQDVVRPRADGEFGELRASPTIHSIGFEWDLHGDTNHNATCTMRYRKKGEQAWKNATSLLRIDYRGWYSGKELRAYRHFNMFAGSLMFLAPGSEYEVELKLTDPDGGAAAKTLEIATNPVPSLGKPIRTLHVAPDGANAQPGDGSTDKPFVGLRSAFEAAKPGDLFLLRSGKYKGTDIKVSGEKNRHIAFKSAQPGGAVITSTLGVAGSYLWFQGLTFVTEDEKEYGGIRIRGREEGRHEVVVVRNTFNNCRYGFSNSERNWNGDPALLSRRWYIADNVYAGGPWSEYFTRLYLFADSDISYNRITTTFNGKGGDAIALRSGCTNVDAHHNDIRDIEDDFFEPDSAYANIRIWCNRGINATYQAVSFQPQMCSPWYIVRNEFVLMAKTRSATVFKTNVFDRNVIVNNTFVVRGQGAQYRANIMLGALSRNNLWVHIYDPSVASRPRGAVWAGDGDRYLDQRYLIGGQSMPNWRTDVDYDGFAWDHIPEMERPFQWDDHYITSVAKLAEALGIEKHGVQLEKDQLFTISDLMAYASEPWSPQRLMLRPDSKAVDAGAVVPNLAETFNGSAPDLGADEFGEAKCHYGPRPDREE